MTQYSYTPRRRATHITAAVVAGTLALTACASSTGDGDDTGGDGNGEVSMVHYFSDTLGERAFDQILPMCTEAGVEIQNNPTEHEAFKDSILVQLAGGNPPDLFSYWAGAKTQYLVDQERVAPLEEVWAEYDLDDAFPEALVESASVYDDSPYLLPFAYHYAGMFYNPSVMADAGVTEMPQTWDDLLETADTLKAAGVTPFALGSMSRWPAQFWFDYLLLRTAGPDYRQRLMAGEASYTDPEVAEAFDLWKRLFDADYFNASPNGIEWTDAADLVANGDAAMTLMGTWITGYWDGNGIEPGTGYDFFPFPEVTPGVPMAALGPVDGWAIAAGAANQASAQEALGCLASPEAQQAMALSQGALAPNRHADLSEQNDVMHQAAEQVQSAPAFVFNYDLATTPEVSEVGLDALAQFVNDPASAASILAQTQSAADGIFAAQ